MATPTTANTFLQRLIGAAALDAAIYEEVEADPTATTQAMAVVVLSSLATGIGARGLGSSTTSITFFSVVALLFWAAWALVTFEVGARLLPTPETRVTVGELLRTLGFAATPGLATLLAAVPGVAVPVFIGTTAWMLVAMVVAVRQALDYTSTTRAVAVCVVGLSFALTFAIVLGLLFGPSVS
jgi:hypothetical protein